MNKSMKEWGYTLELTDADRQSSHLEIQGCSSVSIAEQKYLDLPDCDHPSYTRLVKEYLDSIVYA